MRQEPVAEASPPPGDLLRLDRQICFPLYAASRLLTREYQPFLEPLGITYPQYLVLMVLWEDAPCTVSGIGKRLMLNTNTVTPLLKRLEQLGLIVRQRSGADERVVQISLTPQAAELRIRCRDIPKEVARATTFPANKALALKQLLDELIQTLDSRAHPED